MNKQWNKDGLTRKKLENDFRIHEPFQVLEKNLSNLLARAFSKSSFLYHYQSLAILNEIKQTDTIGNDQIRLFFEMAALKREIGKEYLPCVQWSFFNGKQWEFIKPGNLLSDTTGNLLNTGLVDILLPSPISEEMLDINGDFWLSAKVSCHTQNCSSIRNVYLNPVKARLEIPEKMEALISEELESFTGLVSFEKSMPGLTDIYQIIPAKGGRSQETTGESFINITL